MALFVTYISNNAFPQPLSEEDEAKHLKAMGEGSREARNILIEHNLRLVAHIANLLCPNRAAVRRMPECPCIEDKCLQNSKKISH